MPTLVVAKNDSFIASFSTIDSNLLNVIGASCKRRDILRDSQARKVIEALDNGEITSGRGLNQEKCLKRPSIVEDGLSSEQRAFNKEKLIQLAHFYPLEFSAVELMALDNQLETYIIDVRTSDDFIDIKRIGNLAKKLVETKKKIVYPLVYLIIKLALTLPVATASVEMAFFSMKIVKNRLCNRWTIN
ncbi:uncharacterized protein LOC105635557 [Jatropha curcas]|uniref:uncharacterized protein LOC105635557 n=1 Tax=Jatropha curcas TaxID=180498 RepID=UPI0005FBA7CA|nr:uncharacterized protein LOC105635557 [Jatropha curcas]